ncbi:hypothetical protein CS022_00955 [Veronia nyctiphanis]|uniref:Uncharacterized protein n=1 Tax=Veronia nyctiphanis TaxID=1278244 RepID=A0A4Q0Z093_9GAMM|nr:hypothetical protein CS022_00955 [Veronia nyctiphanis]
MGLPFHIMYAFTGLVFNLVIVYQISYAVLLYQGDQERLLQAAGFNEPHIEESGNALPMSGLNALVEKAKADIGNQPFRRIVIEHFGDTSAVAIFQNRSVDHFSTQAEVHYRFSDQSQTYITHDNYDNAVRSGLQVIASLHFGDFAGYGLRIAFFLFGIATCYIIITGNLMWVEKRAKQRNYSQRGLNFVRRLTVGGFIGVVLATSVGFLAARLLSADLPERAQYLEQLVYFTWILSVIFAQVMKKSGVAASVLLYLSGSCFIATLVADWTLVGIEISQLVMLGHVDILIVEALLITLGVTAIITARYVRKQSRKDSAPTQEISLQKQAVLNQ